jgi:hypothetical protein
MTVAGHKLGARIGDTLTILGALVGVFGVVAMAIKLKIVLTPDMQQLLFYKGLFAAAAGLLVVGAWIGRRGRAAAREELEERQRLDELRGPSELPLASAQARAGDSHSES